MDILNIYIKKIAVYMIFTLFINMLLPDNSYKRHIYLVLGIIIIINMISPIVRISNDLSSYSLDISKLNTQNQINYSRYTQQDIILKEFNREFEKELTDTYSISEATVTSEINNNTLYISNIQIKSNEPDIGYTIAQKYNIPIDSIHVTGDD